MLTTREAADAIGIALKTLQKYVREGRVIPTIRLPGGQMRWDLEHLKDQLRGKPRES
jgi:excisionase family DNA binding protein